MSKIGRNAPCPCGSGIKFKHCHDRLDGMLPTADLRAKLERRKADEIVRQRQQGLGKPIIGMKIDGNQIVGVGNTVYFSKDWKTFPDFLADYIKRKLNPEWGNAEIARPFDERHPLMQWYEAYCKYQQSVIKTPGVVQSCPITGVVTCYLGVAYSLYLLDHNVELQARLINRLKEPGQFQGAYYELIVASILIRAGFELTLEDETDRDAKHCEFAAVSKKTGKRYWVEAKMRAVNGLLGRKSTDGGGDKRPLRQLVPHLNRALAKPAADERLIFIDLNAPPLILPDGTPGHLESALRRLEKYEREELPAGTTAYVFVTNMSAHRQLDETPMNAGAAFGLGIPEFGRPGIRRVIDAYKAKRKHIDAFDIAQAISRYSIFPTTFDGKLASDAFGRPSNRVLIGETYDFGNGVIGTVTTASVDEQAKEMLVGVWTHDGKGIIMRGPMSDDDLAEYREVPDAYFGRVEPTTRHPKDNFEFFEWLMEVNAGRSRQQMLDWFGAHRDRAELEQMNDDDLRMAYCEGHIAALEAGKTGKNTP